MGKIVISSDSTCDLSKEVLEKYDIQILPLSIVKDDVPLKDGVDIFQKDIFAYKEETGKLLTTSAPNVAECEEYVAALREKYGEDCEIIHFDICSDMSSTYSRMNAIAEDVEGLYPIDSENLSTGIGLMVIKAAEMRDEGASAREIVDEINKVKKRVDTSFILYTLEYLHKGGRCSGVAALGANLLKLMPCIELREGAMGVGRKYRGRLENVLKEYTADVLADKDDIELDRVIVTSTMSDELYYNVHNVIEQVKATLPFAEVLEAKAGCTISSHCGPNCLGVLFIRKSELKRK